MTSKLWTLVTTELYVYFDAINAAERTIGLLISPQVHISSSAKIFVCIAKI